MGIGLSMIVAGVLPMPLVYLLRRFQILKVDLDIHQGSIRRNETTASTKQMMDEDDVSEIFLFHSLLSRMDQFLECYFSKMHITHFNFYFWYAEVNRPRGNKRYQLKETEQMQKKTT